MSPHVPSRVVPIRLLALVLSLLGVAVLVASALPGTAEAKPEAKPCGKRLFEDWYKDGRIDGVYAAHCYAQAEKLIPDDVRDYTSFPDELRQARLARQRTLAQREREAGSDGGSGSSGRGSGPGSGSGSGAVPLPRGERGGSTRREGPYQRAVRKLGPREPDSFPIPLLVIAALMGALMAVGGGGLLARRLRARRIQLGR